jgi:hypothetical protein
LKKTLILSDEYRLVGFCHAQLSFFRLVGLSFQKPSQARVAIEAPDAGLAKSVGPTSFPIRTQDGGTGHTGAGFWH